MVILLGGGGAVSDKPQSVIPEMERSGWCFFAYKINADGTQSPVVGMKWDDELKRWENNGRPVDEVLREMQPI